MSLDELVETFRDVIRKRFPDAEWGSLIVHQSTLPDVVIPVTIPPSPAPAVQCEPFRHPVA